MTTLLNWRTSVSASGLQAAAAIARGEPLADEALGLAMAEAAATLDSEIQFCKLPARFWPNLLGLSVSIESNRELARTALQKTVGRTAAAEAAEPRIAGGIAGVEGALARHSPKIAEELPLRVGPLREQWEARGPGLLRRMGLFTEERLMPEQAEVVVLHPALGGHGEAWLAGNQVRIEGVLANPVPQLPEVVRLGWLLSQLQLDLPAVSENVPADRLSRLAQLAMLPAALAAGQDVELCQNSHDLLTEAMRHWRLEGDPATIRQWWETYQESRPPFPVALSALDQMI